MTEQAFLDYLNEPLDNGEPRSNLIATLVKSNGGFEITGWGVISYDSTSNFKRGLEIEESLALLHFEGVFTGFILCGVDAFGIFRPIFNDYVEKIESQGK